MGIPAAPLWPMCRGRADEANFTALPSPPILSEVLPERPRMSAAASSTPSRLAMAPPAAPKCGQVRYKSGSRQRMSAAAGLPDCTLAKRPAQPHTNLQNLSPKGKGSLADEHVSEPRKRRPVPSRATASPVVQQECGL